MDIDKAWLWISVPVRPTRFFFPSLHCKKLFIFDAVYLCRNNVVFKQGTFPSRAATAVSKMKERRLIRNMPYCGRLQCNISVITSKEWPRKSTRQSENMFPRYSWLHSVARWSTLSPLISFVLVSPVHYPRERSAPQRNEQPAGDNCTNRREAPSVVRAMWQST